MTRRPVHVMCTTASLRVPSSIELGKRAVSGTLRELPTPNT